MMEPTPHHNRFSACLPGAVAVCMAALLGGCVVAPYYDAYGNPVAPAVVAPAYAYPYPYDYYYGPAVYPVPVYGSFWFGFHGGGGGHRGWGDHRGWGGPGRGGWGGHGGGWGGRGGRH